MFGQNHLTLFLENHERNILLVFTFVLEKILHSQYDSGFQRISTFQVQRSRTSIRTFATYREQGIAWELVLQEHRLGWVTVCQNFWDVLVKGAPCSHGKLRYLDLQCSPLVEVSRFEFGFVIPLNFLLDIDWLSTLQRVVC